MSEQIQTNALEKMGYKQELKRSLTTWDLIIYGLVFMVPIAPMGIYGYVAEASNGMVVLAYAIGLLGMIFTAYSYARMSEAFPIAGSVYSYAQRGINSSVGFIAGWMILLDYILIPALLYIVAGTALHELVPAIPTVVWILIFIAINTIVNILGIEITARANKIILIGQLIVLAIFVVVAFWAVFQGVNGAHFTFKPIFDPNGFSLAMVASATSMAVLSFLGFDAISTLSEETSGGKQAVGKATVYSLLIVGALFMIQTYLAALIVPGGKFNNLDTAFYQVAEIAGGPWAKAMTLIATIIAWGIADSLVAQAAISRVLYSMSRDTMLPKFLSKVHPKYKTPYASTLIVAIISVIVVNLISLDKLTSLVNFGALTAFLFLNLSVIIYFVYKKKSKSYLKHLVMPLLGFAVIFYVWTKLDTLAFKLGLVWFVVGLIVLAIATKGFKRKPPALDFKE